MVEAADAEFGRSGWSANRVAGTAIHVALFDVAGELHAGFWAPRVEVSISADLAGKWREARRQLDSFDPVTREALLAYWNGHRWIPGDPSYLLDLLHGCRTGRMLLEDGQIRPALVTIPVSAATAAFGVRKPLSRGWFGPAG